MKQKAIMVKMEAVLPSIATDALDSCNVREYQYTFSDMAAPIY